MPVVLYGYETWSLTVEVYVLNVFENKVLRNIFGSKRGGGVTGEWRGWHNQEFHELLLSTSHNTGHHIKKKDMGEACGTYWAEDRRMQGFGTKI